MTIEFCTHTHPTTDRQPALPPERHLTSTMPNKYNDIQCQTLCDPNGKTHCHKYIMWLLKTKLHPAEQVNLVTKKERQFCQIIDTESTADFRLYCCACVCLSRAYVCAYVCVCMCMCVFYTVGVLYWCVRTVACSPFGILACLPAGRPYHLKGLAPKSADVAIALIWLELLYILTIKNNKHKTD